MTPISRRQWLELAAVNTLAGALAVRRMTAQEKPSTEREGRIRQIIEEYEEQGFHRTGTPVDEVSARWLRDEVQRSGLSAALEPFPLQRIDVPSAGLIMGERRIEGLPLFDGGFTDERGIAGRLGALDSDAEIALAEAAPNAAGAGPLGDARRKNRHKAIVCVTRGARPGLCPSNADAFLEPFGPPVLQVSSEHASWLLEQQSQRSDVRLLAHVTRTSAQAFNVTAKLPGANPQLPPLVIMTPRSGWYRCASERGGGLAVWLELMRTLRDATRVRDVLFVASSGHELGHLGIDAFIDRRPGIVPSSVGWLHLGANIGAAVRGGAPPRPPGVASGDPPSARVPQAQGNTLQASDDEFERMLDRALTAAGVPIGVRAPRGRVPAGEAEAVHRCGGRYVSAIGSNALFHNPGDRGPDVIDARAIAAVAEAFAQVATTLAGR
jgi:hypothetical protein